MRCKGKGLFLSGKVFGAFFCRTRKIPRIWGTLSYWGNTLGEAVGADREMGSEQDPPDRTADSVVSLAPPGRTADDKASRGRSALFEELPTWRPSPTSGCRFNINFLKGRFYVHFCHFTGLSFFPAQGIKETLPEAKMNYIGDSFAQVLCNFSQVLCNFSQVPCSFSPKQAKSNGAVPENLAVRSVATTKIRNFRAKSKSAPLRFNI